MRAVSLACAAVGLALCGAAHAGVDFSSTFDGAGSTPAPWNWSSATGTVFGTGAMTAAAGPGAGANYVTQTVVPAPVGDGTGSINLSFDLDLSSMAFDGFYSGPAIGVVGTVSGNKSPIGGGASSILTVNNWKAAPGVTGQYRFGIGSAIRYWSSGGTVTDTFSPAVGQGALYHLNLLIAFTHSGDNWTVTNTLDVTGPSGGNTVELSVVDSKSQTDSGFHGLLDVNSYSLGELNTGNTIDGTSMVFDNFNAHEVVPEPASLGLLSLGALALLRRRAH